MSSPRIFVVVLFFFDVSVIYSVTATHVKLVYKLELSVAWSKFLFCISIKVNTCLLQSVH